MSRAIVAVDVGGTNARFARATLDEAGVPTLGTVRKYKVADHASLEACWAAFVRDDAAAEGTPLPDAACIAFATAIAPEVIKLTNSSWMVRKATLADDLGLAHVHLVNDFEAMAHAVSKLPADKVAVLFGPQIPLPRTGTITVVGPGTGLGVALIVMTDGQARVVATEGGHLDFAPLDALESRIADRLRETLLRVSTERLVAGPGLNAIYQALAAIGGHKVRLMDDAELWAAALDGADAFARTALDRYLLCYGAVVGDLALAHGPGSVVLVGGLTGRMLPLLPTSGFHERFKAKGRFRSLMAQVPVHYADHPEIGLFGAAAAYRD